MNDDVKYIALHPDPVPPPPPEVIDIEIHVDSYGRNGEETTLRGRGLRLLETVRDGATGHVLIRLSAARIDIVTGIPLDTFF